MKRNLPSAALTGAAIVLASGGTALAGGHYLITSTKQIKPSVRHALTGQRGPQGAQGPAGTPGPIGPPGLSNVTTVTSPDTVVPPGNVGGAQAFCPAGTQPIGSGGYADVGNLGFLSIYSASVGIGVVNDTSIPISIHAQAVCATVAASAAPRAHRTDDQFNHDLEKLNK